MSRVPPPPATTDAAREPMPLAEVNLADLDRFTDGVTPWRMFHTLRHQDPVHRQPESAPNSGFWAVTRHADIARVDRDPETLGGKRVRAGEKVVMWFASGNRDEEVFGAPYAFDVARRDNDHLTFGKGGPHLCLGNQLARTEIRVLFEELVPRLADARLAGEARVRSNFVNGIKRLPVRVTLA
ncbi:cytochrome P450 [Streptomyces buecherae]|uniref:cytochrome P450 n=1 Tax=Streptomyces buecherae TaxID=2763006 RepID=UPI0033C128EC